jgi:hypothetical protein
MFLYAYWDELHQLRISPEAEQCELFYDTVLDDTGEINVHHSLGSNERARLFSNVPLSELNGLIVSLDGNMAVALWSL